jgi:hypothetical protein
MTYEVHQLALCLPPMEAGQYADLVESIRVSGLKKPIVLYEGKILFGAHRQKACVELGVDARYEEFIGTMEEAVEAVKIEEIFRRHATTSQRAIALEALRSYGASINGDGGVSDRTRGYAREVLKKGTPALCSLVRDGKVAVSDAAKAVDLPKTEQNRLAKEVATGKAKTITAALRPPTVEGDACEGEGDGCDMYGTPIPESLLDVFSTTLLTDSVASIRSVINVITGCAAWHPFLLQSTTKGALDEVADALISNQPAAICQDCKGVGCRECRGAGWLPRWRVDEIGYGR